MDVYCKGRKIRTKEVCPPMPGNDVLTFSEDLGGEPEDYRVDTRTIPDNADE